MSKHNYSQYSNKKNNQNQNQNRPNAKVEKQETIKPVPEVKPVAPVEPVVLMQETVETVTLPEIVEGTVTNCSKLNVREKPSINSDVICVLDAMSEIEVNLSKSTDKWVRVHTAIGAEGYCMREYVDICL